MAQTTLPLLSSTLGPADLHLADTQGLYVHVPFCIHKCHYCDFYSITHQPADRMSRFVDLILAEADLWTQRVAIRPRTVFFGGGTPTLLPPDLMRRLLEGLGQRFDLSQVEEWTVEANPATLSPEYGAILREAGVDRISMGAQSFDPTELATLERHHNPLDVPRSVEIARTSGIRRLNIDLIYGVPGQDLASWSRSLEQALALGTTHLSCYGLTYEPNTALAVRKRLGRVRAVDEELELAMFRHTRRRLSDAGLPAYEISNYAAPGQECRHNLIYWTGGDYLGLGPSAASHAGGTRWKNRPHLGEWEAAIASGRLPVTDVESLPPEQRAGELVMLRLRLERGLDLRDFAGRTGFDAHALYAEPLRRLSDLGLIEVDPNRVRLTEKGLEVADAVAREFLI